MEGTSNEICIEITPTGTSIDGYALEGHPEQGFAAALDIINAQTVSLPAGQTLQVSVTDTRPGGYKPARSTVGAGQNLNPRLFPRRERVKGTAGLPTRHTTPQPPQQAPQAPEADKPVEDLGQASATFSWPSPVTIPQTTPAPVGAPPAPPAQPAPTPVPQPEPVSRAQMPAPVSAASLSPDDEDEPAPVSYTPPVSAPVTPPATPPTPAPQPLPQPEPAPVREPEDAPQPVAPPAPEPVVERRTPVRRRKRAAADASTLFATRTQPEPQATPAPEAKPQPAVDVPEAVPQPAAPVAQPPAPTPQPTPQPKAEATPEAAPEPESAPEAVAAPQPVVATPDPPATTPTTPMASEPVTPAPTTAPSMPVPEPPTPAPTVSEPMPAEPVVADPIPAPAPHQPEPAPTPESVAPQAPTPAPAVETVQPAPKRHGRRARRKNVASEGLFATNRKRTRNENTLPDGVIPSRPQKSGTPRQHLYGTGAPLVADHRTALLKNKPQARLTVPVSALPIRPLTPEQEAMLPDPDGYLNFVSHIAPPVSTANQTPTGKTRSGNKWTLSKILTCVGVVAALAAGGVGVAWPYVAPQEYTAVCVDGRTSLRVDDGQCVGEAKDDGGAARWVGWRLLPASDQGVPEVGAPTGGLSAWPKGKVQATTTDGKPVPKPATTPSK